MAQDKRLNDLLRWGIEHSDSTHNDPTAEPPQSQLTPELMAALMGGPSDADLMKASMQIIQAPDSEAKLEDKLTAFDNLEQLIESLDNANNLAALSLWTPLLEQLQNSEKELRKMAAWCVGTAVQNNVKTQETLLAVGGIPKLVELADKQGEPEDVKRKAIYALSSACRNYQPAMDLLAEELEKRGQTTGKIDAADMEQVDTVMSALREKAKSG